MSKARHLFDAEHPSKLWLGQSGEEFVEEASTAPRCVDCVNLQQRLGREQGNIFSTCSKTNSLERFIILFFNELLQTLEILLVLTSLLRHATWHLSGQDDDIGCKNRFSSTVAFWLGGSSSRSWFTVGIPDSMGSLEGTLLQSFIPAGFVSMGTMHSVNGGCY